MSLALVLYFKYKWAEPSTISANQIDWCFRTFQYGYNLIGCWIQIWRVFSRNTFNRVIYFAHVINQRAIWLSSDMNVSRQHSSDDWFAIALLGLPCEMTASRSDFPWLYKGSLLMWVWGGGHEMQPLGLQGQSTSHRNWHRLLEPLFVFGSFVFSFPCKCLTLMV